MIKLLWFFEYCGFNTEFIETLPYIQIHHSRTRKTLILCTHIFILCVSAFWSHHSIMMTHLFVGDVGTANDSLKVCSGIVAYILFLIESRTMQLKQQRFWKIYKQIGKVYRVYSRFAFGGYFIKTFQWTIAVLFCYISMIYALYSNDVHKYFFLHWTAFALIVVPQQLRQCFYLLLVQLLSNELQMIELETLEIAKVSQIECILPNNVRNTFERQRLKWIRDYYAAISEMVECMNDAFGWSSIGNFAHCFILFGADLNWMYWRLYNNRMIRSPFSELATMYSLIILYK